MKKIFLFLFLLFSAQIVNAQVSTVITNLSGRAQIVVEVKRDGWVVLDLYGKIIDIVGLDGFTEFYSDFFDHEAGKIKSIDGVKFQYYSDFYDYESGKIKQIGSISFKYYSDFYAYESGKLKSIGNVDFKYHSDFYDYQKGKIKSIGGVPFEYNSDFYEHQKGLIKSIGSNKYTYSNSWSSRRGRIESGMRKFKANNIEFIVKF